MKLSLWQQFSSNHSDGYMMIGTFETSQQAENAAQIVQTIEERLQKLWASQPDEERPDLSDERHMLTDAEREIMQEYSLDIENVVDWMARQDSAGNFPTDVATFEQHVFFTTIYQTQTRHVPFPELVRHLGGKVSEEAGASYILVNIKAAIRHTLTADYIKAVVEEALEDNESRHDRPWILFYDGQLVANPEQVTRDIDIYRAHEAALVHWHTEHNDLIDHLREQVFRHAGDPEMAETIDRQLQIFSGDQDKIEPTIPLYTRFYIEELIEATWIMASTESRVALHDGHLQITGVSWSDMGHGLPALIAWLRALGCRDVTYEFVQRSRT